MGRAMDTDGLEKLRDFLNGVAGGLCTLPFERIRELTGQPLPEAASSAAWWTDPAGWCAWPPAAACRAAGWRVESVHAASGLVRLVRC
ncbi:MAG: hypothetical protein F4Y57_08880 [Acidobacteria bacterium]|nr:hypothetical protein [Acidobacteriota bacterium]